MQTQRIVAGLSLAAGLLAIGCRVESHKHGDGDNFRVATPFGGLEVKTNEAAALSGVGLPGYPGAELVKKNKDSGSADVDMSFGGFQLRVKVLTFRTHDSPERVKSFYGEALHRFGDVIVCADKHAVGTPARTAEGLTCDKDRESHITVDPEMSGKLELKAGSEHHQHIVSIEPEGEGTRFGLISLDLPGRISIGDKDPPRQ